MEHGGHAYWINRTGVVFCIDVKTGEQKYAERVKQSLCATPLRDPFARPLWATPLGIGDRLHLFGKDGLTTVLKPGPSFEILRENTLWDPNLAIDQSVIDRETDSVRKPCTPNRRSWAPQRSTGRC